MTSEAADFNCLAICQHSLGQFPGDRPLRAGADHRPARPATARQSRSSLPRCRQRDLGQLTGAIDLIEQALATSRETGYRSRESDSLDNLADAYGDLGAWEQAAEYSRQAIEIGDAIGSVQMQFDARLTLARIQLLAGDLQAAHQAARAARDALLPLSGLRCR